MDLTQKVQDTALQHPNYQWKHHPFPQTLRDVCCQSIMLTDLVPGKVYQFFLSLISFLKLCFFVLPVAILIANVNYLKSKGGERRSPSFHNSHLKPSSSSPQILFLKKLRLSILFRLLLIQHLNTGLECCLISLCFLPKNLDGQAGYSIISQALWLQCIITVASPFSNDKDKRSCTTAYLAKPLISVQTSI